MFQIDHTDEKEYYQNEAFDEEEVYSIPERKPKVGDLRLTKEGHAIIGTGLFVILNALLVFMCPVIPVVVWPLAHSVFSFVFGILALAWLSEHRIINWKEVTIIMFFGVEFMLYLTITESILPIMFEQVEVRRK